MLNRRFMLLAVAIFLVAGFLIGLFELFKLRFEEGNVFPAYSSLRTDPLGTKAFYHSLEDLSGITVSRLIDPLHKLQNGRETTLFVAGLPSYELRYATDQEVRDLEYFMNSGGRIVVTVFPEAIKTWSTRRAERREDRSAAKDPDLKTDEKEDMDDLILSKKFVSLRQRWNFSYDLENLPLNDERVSEPVIVVRQGEDILPDNLSWYSGIYFKDLGPNWRTVYSREEKPVLIEHPFGKGSLVLASDSYFISNEALRKDRQPELLAWLAGKNNSIVFNETHLGIRNDPGIAALARKYRLHGFIAGLVLLAALFIWKNAMHFVPPHEELELERNSMAIAGKDSASGFTNLLRRSISQPELIPVCFEEFKKSVSHSPGFQSVLPQIEQIVAEEAARPVRERKPIETYQRISKILAEKKHL